MTTNDRPVTRREVIAHNVAVLLTEPVERWTRTLLSTDGLPPADATDSRETG